jgi:monofunctional biosynthetic peptidoglycan transglycosylase
VRGRSRRRRLRAARAGLAWRLLARALLVALALSAGPVLCVRVVDPPASAIMLQWRLAALRDSRPAAVDHEWVPLSAISPAVSLAVVAAEDQRFPQHRGFDLEAIGDALDEAGAGAQLRGASTISQQVAKNLFLWQGRSWLRKGLEAWLTVWIELLWPKRRILEVYLNVAELGPGVFGVEAASRRCFGRPAAALGPREAALLAAALPSPRMLRCDPPTPALRARAARVEAAMARLGPGWLRGIAPAPRRGFVNDGV